MYWSQVRLRAGHHTNSDPLNLFPFIESRTDKNEEHTKEESRTLCIVFVLPFFLTGFFLKIKKVK
jgi:hypothetical protein